MNYFKGYILNPFYFLFKQFLEIWWDSDEIMYHKCIFETVLNISYISSYARDLFAIARSIYVWTNIFDVWKYSETVWSKIFSFYSLVNYLKSQNKVIWMFFPHESLWISKFIIELRKKNNSRQSFLFRSSTFIY